MENYIDGFVFPISKQHLEAYKTVAKEVAEIWKKNGALAYFEYINEGTSIKGCPTFAETLSIKEGEIAILGWISFSSKKSRNQVFEKVANDTRMEKLVAPITNPSKLIFDAKRMVYGTFKPLIQSI